MEIHKDLTTDDLLLLLGDREVTIYRLRKRINELEADAEAVNAALRAGASTHPPLVLVDHGEQ